MSVTAFEKIEDSEQADGSRHIAFRFVFHTGEIIIKRFLAASTYDEMAGLSEMVPIVEQQMIDNECSNLIGIAETGGTDVFDASPVHPETITLANRKKNFAKKALRYIVNNKDIKLARTIFLKTWDYLANESGWTGAQIAGYLGISLITLQRINSRFQWIRDNLTGIDADDSYVGDVD